MSLPEPILPWAVAEIQGLEEVKPTPVASHLCYRWVHLLSQVGNSRVVGTALRFGRTRLRFSLIPILILFQFTVISGWTRWPIWHHPELPSFPRFMPPLPAMPAPGPSAVSLCL